jgi:hypothetical protein
MTGVDLFGEQIHDAGGKRKISLPAGVRGDAVFCGPKDCYRPLLRRWIGDQFPDRYLMFLGMNPSTAMAHIDDPTIIREWSFATREGFSAFAKCNVADYRLTDNGKFRDPDIVPSSDRNLEIILTTAAKAYKIIVCHGKLPKPLSELGKIVISSLQSAGNPLYCLGTNNDGSPKHPLFVGGNVPLRPYVPLAIST